MTDNLEMETEIAERAMVLRYCTRFAGDPHTGEDLAQATMLAAWRHEHELRDSRARSSWLLGIARNTCRTWARRRERERVVSSSGDAGLEIDLPDSFDLEVDLEREELASLLDRAMALLTPEVRDVLVRRFLEESPQAEVAEALGLSEGAVEARVHRGKLALRRVLTTTLGNEAVALGLVRPDGVGHEITRLWCPSCSRRRLEGRLDPEAGRLVLDCPDCMTPYEHHIDAHHGDGLRDIKTYKPALGRTLDSIHHMFRVRASDGFTPCPRCGVPLRIQHRENDESFIYCDRCDLEDHETWASLTWSLPEARRFLREHPRARLVPTRSVETDGSPAIVTGLQAPDSAARFEAVMLRDTLDVVRTHGAPPEREA